MILLFITIEMDDPVSEIQKMAMFARKTNSEYSVIWDEKYLGKDKVFIAKKVTKKNKGRFIFLKKIDDEFTKQRNRLLKKYRCFCLKSVDKKKNEIYQYTLKCKHPGYIDVDDIEKVSLSESILTYSGNCFVCDDSFYEKNKNLIKKPEIVIIRGDNTIAGIYGIMAHYISGFHFSDEFGLPVFVDMLHNKTPYVDSIGQNAWNFFYKQDFDYDNAKLLKYFEWGLIPFDYKVFDCNSVLKTKSEEIRTYNYLMHKYSILNDEIKNEVEARWSEIKSITGNKRILGVKFRATDYLSEFGWGDFPFQADPKFMCSLALKKMKEWNCDYVYLAVESQESMNCFKKEFGNNLLVYDCLLISNYTGDLPAAEAQAIISGRKKAGKDYIITEEILAKCDCLLATQNSGAIFAPLIKNGEYDNIHFVNKTDICSVNC